MRTRIPAILAATLVAALAPAGVATADVRDLLEALAHELMVDIELAEAAGTP